MTTDPLPPSLGGAVCAWVERYLVHGPGEIMGEPVRLTPFQVEYLWRLYELRPDGRRLHRKSYLSLPKGSSKDLALDTPVPTPGGWTTQGALRVGDEVFDEHGDVCRVAAVHPDRLDDCYRLTFSDGTSVVAGKDHTWPVVEFTGGRKIPGETPCRGDAYYRRDLRTSELAAAGVRFERPLTKGRTKATRGGVARYRTLPTPELQTPDADLLVPPWTLGFWLGDGSSSAPKLTVNRLDLDDVVLGLRADGVPHHLIPSEDRQGSSGVWLEKYGRLLARLGVLGDKHVPPEYLRSSAKQRRALLQGLMDSDGTVTKGGAASLSTTSPAILDGAVELARSLGYEPTVSSSRAVFRGKDCGTAWTVRIHCFRDDALFTVARKAARLRDRGPKPFSSVRTITSVERVPTVPTRCVTVDSPSHLYLVGEGMVPTHNSELAGFVALVEGLGPARCVGFDEHGQPVPAPARAPQVVCAATEVGQAGLSYGVVHTNLRESRALRDAYPGIDAGLTRSLLPNGGSIRPITAGAASKEGALLTFIVCDEVGYWTLPEAHRLWEILSRGLVKRPSTGLLAISTAHRPGEQSVAERLYDEARRGSGLFFVERSADPGLDPDDPEQRLDGLRHVYASTAPWVDVEEVAALYDDPTLDPVEWRRHFWNQVVADASRFVDLADWRRAARGDEVLRPGDRVALGFDGSIREDSTALVAVRIADGLVSVVDVWQRPPGHAGASWTVPFGVVDATVRDTFERYDVPRMYADPFGWGSYVSDWSRDHEGRVVEWETRRFRPMDAAIERFTADLRAGRLLHDGGAVLTEHVMNCHLRERSGYRIVTKERPHSPKKIDAAIAAILAWEAAADSGHTSTGTKKAGRVYAFR